MFECAEEALAVPGFGINVERHLSVVQICQAPISARRSGRVLAVDLMPAEAR